MENGFNPLVSVITPVYNGSNYVKEAIDSALAQTYKNIEVIVVNDGSTDDTEEIVKRYGDKIRYFSKENGGVATALNLAIKEARGEYISWLSHDDVYLPNKVKSQIEELNELEDKDTILFSDFEIIDSQSNVIGKRVLKEMWPEKRQITALFALLNGMIHGCTLLIKRDIFFECNLFDESLLTVQDYSLWFDFFKKYKTSYLNKILIQSRAHPEQGHRTVQPSVRQNEGRFLWRKIILGLTIKDVAEMIGVSSIELGATNDIENLTLRYASGKTLKRIYKHNKKDKFTTADLKSVFSVLPQYPLFFRFKDIVKSVFKNLHKLTKVIFSHQDKVRKNYPKPQLIISLTSYPARINTVNQTIQSLLNQSMKADKVILWLALEQFPNKEADLPQQLLDLRKSGLTIDWYHDIKSYKKLIPALKKYPDAIVVTADDDLLYQKDWLLNLYHAYLQDKKTIWCHRAHRIILDKHGKMLPYNLWKKCVTKNIPSARNFPTTGGGVLYPPQTFYKDVLDEKRFMDIAPTADDIWFWTMIVLNAKKVNVVKQNFSIQNIEGSQEQNLFKDNKYLNDTYLTNVLEAYPEMQNLLKESAVSRLLYLGHEVRLLLYKGITWIPRKTRGAFRICRTQGFKGLVAHICHS